MERDLVVKDRNRSVARLVPLAVGERIRAVFDLFEVRNQVVFQLCNVHGLHHGCPLIWLE